MSKEHHGASVKTPRGFVDIFNAFLLKNLESYIVWDNFLIEPKVTHWIDEKEIKIQIE